MLKRRGVLEVAAKMEKIKTSDDDTTSCRLRFARLLLEPEDYCEIIGVSLKNWVLGPRAGGVGGNEAQHKFLTRMRRSSEVTQNAVAKFIKHIEFNHQLSFLNPLDAPSKALQLGTWAIAESGLCQRAKHTLSTIERLVLASNSLQLVAETGGPKALAVELRRLPPSRSSGIFLDCADQLEKSNSGDYRAAIATVHIFVASCLAFNLLIETHPNRTEGFSALRKLVYGDDKLKGPDLAVARWLATAQQELGFETKTAFYTVLSPHLDPENARIEWSKVANGHIFPPLDRLRADLKGVFEASKTHMPNSELHERLDLGLRYCAFVARSYGYLQKQNVTKAHSIFQLAVAEIEDSWGRPDHPT